MAEGMSPAEAMLAANNNDGWSNGMGFMWIFALLILANNGGFGGWGGGNAVANAIGYENLATSAEVQRGFDSQNSMANQREILAAVNSGTAQTVATANQVFHDMLGVFSDKYSELQRDIAGIALAQQQAIANQSECCCNVLRAIDGVNYNQAMNTAAINANVTAQIQGLKDMYTSDRMADMQNRINQLELQNAMNGVVRYPTMTAYTSGANPFCNCMGM